MELLPLTCVIDEFLSDSASESSIPNEAVGFSLNMSHSFISPFAYPAMIMLLKTDAAYKMPPK